MSWSVNKHSSSLLAFAILVILQVVGIVGLNSPYHEMFERIAWLNMLVSFGVVFAFHPIVNSRFFLFCAAAFSIGMSAEIFGVKTGLLFGQYYYTPKFGWQVWEVPLIIGLNWVLLAYICGVSAHRYLSNKWLAITTASAAMASLDVLLEPFAVRHGLWVWHSVAPPLQNYMAWFGIAFLIQLLYPRLVLRAYNVNAFRYLVLLTIFLLIDYCLSFA